MCNQRSQGNYSVALLHVLMLFCLAAAGFITVPEAKAQNQSLMWQNTQTGDVTAWYMNGILWTGNYDYLGHGIPTQWQIVANGYFNSDTSTDFIWQNSQTGDVSYWLMSGTQPLCANIE